MSTQMELNRNLAQMLKGGVIMDVTTPEQAKIAEEAGACAVMALERIPADIRAAGGVSRMSDPKMIKGIQDAVSIPVMAKCRIGHFAEARILQAIKIDYIDESEVLSPADDKYHINKNDFKVPFVCGAKDLGEALRRINEGAAMIRTKGEPGTGDVVQAVRHMRMMMSEIRRIQNMSEDELYEAAKQLQVPYNLVEYVHENGKLPVVNFAAGGVATPADAALMMHLGAEGVFVGSGIFKSGNPAKRASAIVQAVTNYTDDKLLAELSEDLGEAMVGINKHSLDALGVESFEIRQKKDIEKPFDGLIIPGGESTVIGKLLHKLDLYEPIKNMIENGMPVFGTCAGLIVLAKNIEGEQAHIGTMDITVRRNAYGKQIDSFSEEVVIPEVSDKPFPLVFIRAPWIDSVGDNVKILCKLNGHIVAARENNMLVTSFHPELTKNLDFHKYFINMIK